MITTITLNPAIDRTVYIDRFVSGELNRERSSVTMAGGKGINCSRMLTKLGADVNTLAFTGGLYGDMLKDMLEYEGVGLKSINTQCETRLNIKIIADDGECTELNSKGGPVLAEEVEVFHRLVNNMLKAQPKDVENYWLLCGSIPQGVEKDVYKSLSEQISRYGAFVAVDCSGDTLCSALEGKVDLIKPNIHELSTLVERPLYSVDDVYAACGEVFHRYGCDVICTMGEKGALYVGKQGKVSVPSHKVEVRGFAGAGDTFLASYIYCQSKKYDIEYSMAFASAAAAAKVALPCTAVADYDTIIEMMGEKP